MDLNRFQCLVLFYLELTGRSSSYSGRRQKRRKIRRGELKWGSRPSILTTFFPDFLPTFQHPLSLFCVCTHKSLSLCACVCVCVCTCFFNFSISFTSTEESSLQFYFRNKTFDHFVSESFIFQKFMFFPLL